ncbi:MAG: hypothetical protein B2I17_01980 [Thermoplasmatales archaeon B_DKE]|nr:MAG: hypothetical protein B2I17_01980 [Thermoplasmatales archaeon B_DKE]
MGIYMDLDAHKHTIFVTEIESDGQFGEQNETQNNQYAWDTFRSGYLDLKPETALEISAKGKYVARLLRDIGFFVNVANPSRMPDV